MRVRNIIIVFILNYLAIIVVCGFSELGFVVDTAQEVQVMVQTATDMALEQAQATDDFFISNAGYNTDTSSSYTIKMEKDGRFQSTPLYEALYGVNTSNASNKGVIFNKLYNTPDFREKAKKFSSIKSSISYYNTSRTGLLWYKFPKIAQVGLDVTGREGGITLATSPSGSGVDTSVSQGIIGLYAFDTAKRTGYDYSSGTVMDYYMSPISLGITYINPDLLNQLFLNNMDLLMRVKYDKSGTNLSSEDGGNGVYKGVTWSESITDTGLNTYNAINNGKFTLVKGTTREVHSGFKTYNGILPKIEYKVIDMYNPANDNVLVMLFGANKTDKNGITYPTKADYLKSLGANEIDPATGLRYSSKLISVAKVTVYADIIIPYQTLAIRDFRANIDSSSKNYVDIEHKGTTGVIGFSGNDCYSYTKYFAVAP